MKRFAFVSRHKPTQGQVDLAAEKGIRMTWVGDMDAQEITPYEVSHHGTFEGIIVVNPIALARMIEHCDVGVFVNNQRPPEGGMPTFEARELVIHPRTGKKLSALEILADVAYGEDESAQSDVNVVVQAVLSGNANLRFCENLEERFNALSGSYQDARAFVGLEAERLRRQALANWSV